MRMMAFAAAVCLALSGAAPASAQDAMATAGASLEQAMAQAEADAARPGDEQLTCEAIQAETITTMTDPGMRAELDELGATAEAQQQRMQEQQGQMRTQMATGIVTGIIGSFIPGAGYAQQLAMQAQMAQQQAQAEIGMREMAGMMGNMEAAMPGMTRAQRLYELAQAQECAFLEEMQAQEQQEPR